MRILHFVDNLNQGGEQKQILELCQRLGPDFDQHVLYYHRDDFFRPALEAAGATLHFLPKRVGLDPAFFLRLRSFLRAQAFELVHVRLSGPSFWGALACPSRTPLLNSEASSGKRGRLRALSRRVVHPRARYILCNSEARRLEVLQESGLPPERVLFVPNINSPEQRQRGAQAAATRVFPGAFTPQAPLIIGTAGRLYGIKDPALIPAALALLPPRQRALVRVLHCGKTVEAELKARMDQIVAEAGLDYHFLGELPDLHQFYQDLHLFLLPSRFEGMPNVVQEAGAYGLPVAATPVGDVPLWVQPGTTGFLFPVGDAQALAQVLARVLEEPALLPRLSQGMLARVGAQDPLEGLARTRAIYKEIACQKGRLG